MKKKLTGGDGTAAGLRLECAELADVIEVQARRTPVHVRVAVHALKLKSNIHTSPLINVVKVIVCSGAICYDFE